MNHPRSRSRSPGRRPLDDASGVINVTAQLISGLQVTARLSSSAATTVRDLSHAIGAALDERVDSSGTGCHSFQLVFEGRVLKLHESLELVGVRDGSDLCIVRRPRLSILLALENCCARLFDVESAAILRAYEGHTRVVQSAAFSTDGLLVLTASNDCTIRLYDAEGTTLSTCNFKASVIFSTISPNSTKALVALRNKTVVQVDLSTGASMHTYRLRRDHAASAVYSPDGSRILITAPDIDPRVYWSATGVEDNLLCIDRNQGHRRTATTAACFSPMGNHILTGDNNGVARLYDICTGRCSRVFKLAYRRRLTSVAFAPSGNSVLLVSADGTATIYAVESGLAIGVCGRRSPWPTGKAMGAYSADGASILVALSEDPDGVIQVFDAETGEQTHVLTAGQRVQSAIFSR